MAGGIGEDSVVSGVSAVLTSHQKGMGLGLAICPATGTLLKTEILDQNQQARTSKRGSGSDINILNQIRKEGCSGDNSSAG